MITAQKGMQQKLLECEADFILLGACRGGGMTTGMFLHAKKNSETPNFIAEYWDSSNNEWIRKKAIDIIGLDGYRYSKLQFEFSNNSKISFKKNKLNKPDCVYLEDISRKPEELLEALKCDKLVSSCYMDRYSWLDNWMREFKLYDEKIRYVHIGDDLSKAVFKDTKQELVDMGFNSENIRTFQYITADLAENTALIESDPNYVANIMAGRKESAEELLNGTWED